MAAIHMNNEEGNGPLCGSRGTGHTIDVKNITCKRCLKKMGVPVEPNFKKLIKDLKINLDKH